MVIALVVALVLIVALILVVALVAAGVGIWCIAVALLPWSAIVRRGRIPLVVGIRPVVSEPRVSIRGRSNWVWRRSDADWSLDRAVYFIELEEAGDLRAVLL